MAVRHQSCAVFAAVMLAAGNSRRFGADKRRYVLGTQPMLQQSLATPLLLNLPTWLVLKPADKNCLPELLADWRTHAGLSVVYAQEAAKGMGHTLAYGVSQLTAVDGVLVFLADMPWIQARTVEQLMAHFAPGKIIVPRYSGRTGHPVLFASHWFDDLQDLRGDRGARDIIRNNADQVVFVDVDDEGVVRDMDRPAD